MPGLIRRRTSPVSSPDSKKRRIHAPEPTVFPYPDLPVDCIDPHADFPSHRHGTSSSDWGSDEVAAARACLEQTVTRENRELLRTYHPSLGPIEGVWVMEDPCEKPIWIMGLDADSTMPTTHAGGREIHILPAGIAPWTTQQLSTGPVLHSPLSAALNPRRFLPANDLCMLREMFPSAVGARVWISGFIVILFKSRADIEKSWVEKGRAADFGDLRLLYDVIEDEPTRLALSRGAAIAAKPDTLEATASLGLKLRFGDGREAVTVPTHAFVRLRNVSKRPLLRPLDWFLRVKRALSRFALAKRHADEPAIVGMRHGQRADGPIGKSVFLAGSARKVGTITATYDRISSRPMLFPSGFQHDLSLVTADGPSTTLPDIVSPDGAPRVIGWGDYRDVLDGRPVFVTAFHAVTGHLNVRSGFGVSRQAHKALVEGTQYVWDRELLSQGVSLLWRTEYDGDDLAGYSGSALCLGQIQDPVCRAVCFQNFQTPLYSREFLRHDHRRPPSHTVAHPSIKGGFLLPAEVREADILCGGPATFTAPDTFPRSARDSAELRRSLSSHQ